MRTVIAILALVIAVALIRAAASGPSQPPPTHLSPSQCAALATAGDPAASDPVNCP